MKEYFKFEKAFGPVASFSGYVIAGAGLIALYFSWTGLILVFFGVFVGFTNSGTTIDYTNRKVKFSNNIFGLIKIGKWLNIADDMSIGIKKSNKSFRTYSQSNRVLEIFVKTNKIYLFDLQGKPVMPLKKIGTINNSGKELEDLSRILGLTVRKQ